MRTIVVKRQIITQIVKDNQVKCRNIRRTKDGKSGTSREKYTGEMVLVKIYIYELGSLILH
jgi:hypothetical protein